MPRPRYPSDEKRRWARPHVKVHLTIQSHARLGNLWRDPEQRGMLVELWRLAAQKFAGNNEDTVTLQPGDLKLIANRKSDKLNLKLVQTLCEVAGYVVSTSDDIRSGSITVKIRNFAKKQGFSRNSASNSAGAPTDSLRSDSDSDSDPDKKEKNPEGFLFTESEPPTAARQRAPKDSAGFDSPAARRAATARELATPAWQELLAKGRAAGPEVPLPPDPAWQTNPALKAMFLSRDELKAKIDAWKANGRKTP